MRCLRCGETTSLTGEDENGKIFTCFLKPGQDKKEWFRLHQTSGFRVVYGVRGGSDNS